MILVLFQGHASFDGPQSFDNTGSTRLDDMITAVCNELSIRDALFRFSVRSTYGLLRTRPLSVNTFRPQLLKGAVDELVQALKNFPQPEFFQETHQPCVPYWLYSLALLSLTLQQNSLFDNVHARLAWIGGLGRAQSEIQQNLATLDEGGLL